MERYRIKANLIHNSAVRLILCVDNSWHIDEIKAALEAEGFEANSEAGMELLTVRCYNDELMQRYAFGENIVVRQTNSKTVRVVRRKE